MSLLSYNELLGLVEKNVIENAVITNINSASIDIRLGRYVMIESTNPRDKYKLLGDKTSGLEMSKFDLRNSQLVLHPGQFILAQSEEVFHLPENISAEYKLKSSMARLGLEHLNAGWCDAGWNGSVLTLELKNMTNNHHIIIKEGDKIGQIVFFSHSPVPKDMSYAKRGSYNGDKEVTGVKTR